MRLRNSRGWRCLELTTSLNSSNIGSSPSETPISSKTRRPGSARPLGWLRLSYYALLFAVAVTGGVYVGQGAAARTPGNEDSQLLTGYYEAFSQSGFADEWEQLLDTDEKEL